MKGLRSARPAALQGRSRELEGPKGVLSEDRPSNMCLRRVFEVFAVIRFIVDLCEDLILF